MKTLAFTLLISAALSCGNSNDKSNPEIQESTSEAVAVNETAEDQETMLTGVITPDELQQEPYSNWFTPAYEAYNPSTEELQVIKENIDDFDIKVLMGTWCGDSRREVPKLIKLLEEVNYDMDKLEIVAVDRSKTIPEGVEISADFEMVPTIIFYKDGEEVNRFVEYSIGSFEEDIARIVSEKEYSNPYAE